MRTLVCDHCGVAFGCGTGGRDGSCWCADESFRVPMPASDAADCLCPACLRAHAARLQAEDGRCGSAS